MPSQGSTPDVDQLTVERAAQALAHAIGPRRAWCLVVDDPANGERLYTSETPERARALLRRAAERRRS
jgi:hypothetical protein